MQRVRILVGVLAALLVAGGCGAVTTPGAPSTAEPAAAGEPAAAPAPDGGCPLDAADLSTATSFTWELSRTEPDHPLETVDSVTALVCVFTSSDRPQSGGDPLVLRVDTVTGSGAAVVRSAFEDTCTEFGGALEDLGGGAEGCRSDGTVTEGNLVAGDRTVDVYAVLVDAETAEILSSAFPQIMDLVR
jgi:hypothetical protein